MTQEEKLAQVYDGTNPEVLPEYLRRLLTHSSEDTEIDELGRRFEGKTVNEIVNDMIYGPPAGRRDTCKRRQSARARWAGLICLRHERLFMDSGALIEAENKAFGRDALKIPEVIGTATGPIPRPNDLMPQYDDDDDDDDDDNTDTLND